MHVLSNLSRRSADLNLLRVRTQQYKTTGANQSIKYLQQVFLLHKYMTRLVSLPASRRECAARSVPSGQLGEGIDELVPPSQTPLGQGVLLLSLLPPMLWLPLPCCRQQQAFIDGNSLPDTSSLLKYQSHNNDAARTMTCHCWACCIQPLEVQVNNGTTVIA